MSTPSIIRQLFSELIVSLLLCRRERERFQLFFPLYLLVFYAILRFLNILGDCSDLKFSIFDRMFFFFVLLGGSLIQLLLLALLRVQLIEALCLLLEYILPSVAIFN